MIKKSRIFFTFLISSLTLSLFCSAALADEIEIKPVLEGQNYYVIQLGRTQTFEANSVIWDEEKEEAVPNRDIRVLSWTFDSRFLELEGKTDQTITLKAIKARTSKLTALAKVGRQYVTKTIFIVIK